jgi:hypothetical protein
MSKHIDSLSRGELNEVASSSFLDYGLMERGRKKGNYKKQKLKNNGFLVIIELSIYTVTATP